MSEATIGVIIGESTSREMPHRKFTIGGAAFYVTQYPEGDYNVIKSDNCKSGFCGDNVAIFMEDGTTEVVKGPWLIGGSVEFKATEKP